MFTKVVLCAALASVALGNFAANQYFDGLLNDLRLQATSSGLDPTRVYPFQFKVKGNGLTNRDLKVNVTQGSIFGLGSVLRKGDCSYGSFAGEYKLGCQITLSPARILLNAEVKGDSILAKWHSISTSSVVESNTYALVEIQGRQGLTGRVVQVVLYPVTMTSSVSQGKLDLNKSRLSDFVKQLNTGLASQLSIALTGPFSSVVNSLAANRRFP